MVSLPQSDRRHRRHSQRLATLMNRLSSGDRSARRTRDYCSGAWCAIARIAGAAMMPWRRWNTSGIAPAAWFGSPVASPVVAPRRAAGPARSSRVRLTATGAQLHQAGPVPLDPRRSARRAAGRRPSGGSRTRLPPFSGTRKRAGTAVERELGAPAHGALSASFEEAPVSAASIAQVHLRRDRRR